MLVLLGSVIYLWDSASAALRRSIEADIKRDEAQQDAAHVSINVELEQKNAELQEMLMLYTKHVFQEDISRMVNGALSYSDGEWKQGEVGNSWTIPTDLHSLTQALQEKKQWQSTQATSH
jgi:hypothetical protein